MEVLFGRNAVREALRARRRKVYHVFVTEGAQLKGTLADIAELCRRGRIPLHRVSKVRMGQLAGRHKAQGIVAQVSAYPYVGLDEIMRRAAELGEAPFLLMLDSLQDPQNVGSLLRTAEAVGVHGVIIPVRRSVGITPAVSRASVGAVEHLNITRVPNLARVLDELKRRGVWVIGIEDHPDAIDYRQARLDSALALVLGGEGQGMRRLVAQRCDLLVHLPMRGQINSLNVAAAGSVVLYRAWDARQMAEGAR